MNITAVISAPKKKEARFPNTYNTIHAYNPVLDVTQIPIFLNAVEIRLRCSIFNDNVL